LDLIFKTTFPLWVDRSFHLHLLKMLSSFLYLALAQLGVAAAVTNNTKSCTAETFSSIDLPNIKISSVDVTSRKVSWPSTSDLLNVYRVPKNGTVAVCQLTVNYTHHGWNDNVTTWISLPLDSWNGRFAGMGGGGYTTGQLTHNSQAAFEGFASVSTDGGHGQSATTESWALAGEGNVDWPNLYDFSSVALDDAASLGKAAIKLFYGRAAKYSYWNGCSTGGRQGHMMAQRYPTQYDGILAGAPAINWDKFIPAEYWPQVMMKELGKRFNFCRPRLMKEFFADWRR
jgi:feruloyl esterase